MLFTIKINKTDVEMSNAFAWMFKYKSQFKEDPAAVLVPAFGDAGADRNDAGKAAIASIGFTRLSQIAWAMAKTANKAVPDPVTWVNSFEVFNILDFAGDLLEKAVEGMTLTTEEAETSKNQEAVEETAEE